MFIWSFLSQLILKTHQQVCLNLEEEDTMARGGRKSRGGSMRMRGRKKDKEKNKRRRRSSRGRG